MSNTNLPTITDLVSDLEGYKKMDELNVLLSQQPPKKWVKKHPIIKKEIINDKGQKVKVPYEYIPIDKVEYLLRKIFKSYKIEVLREGTMFNAVFVTVRVWYKDLVTGEWMYHDGTGAHQLQTKKGASPSDLSNINHGAVGMSLPLAKTLAIKDACDMFGDLFGANLNRMDVKTLTVDENLKTPEEQHEELKEYYNTNDFDLTPDEEGHIDRIIKNKESNNYEKAMRLLKSKIKTNE